jgi:hypothetical protein
MGSFRLYTWPKGFDQMAVLNRHGGNPEELRQYRIILGPIEVPLGKREAVLELRLQEGAR